MAEWSTFLAAVAGLANALVWPLVVLFLILAFRDPISDLLRRDDLTVAIPGGWSLNVKRKVTEAADAIQDASRAKSGERALSRPAALAEAIDSHEQLSEVDDPVVLWVDDIPSNNRNERAAMEALGIRFDLSMSTEDGLKQAHEKRYDAIISDMGRPEGKRAGYALLDALRARGDKTPLVFYAASRSAKHFDESVEHGAMGCTNRSSELIRMVVGAIRTSRARS